MKLSEISKEPKLIEVSLDDKQTIEEYGEALVFHTWDRQPMEIFMQLANVDPSEKGSATIINIVKDLILDEKGKPLLTAKNMLPSHILLRVITKVTESLGK